ncbi:MAG TPA: GTP cyclohydrolase I [Baekduia sp.]|jgi:GTP cyclohydrolase I|nr:GTP cyclohydrolase I [Baekduia sp.]
MAPSDIIGLSKLGRGPDLLARRLQVRGRMTVQIAEWLAEQLPPKGIGVVLEAEHLCGSLRGVSKPGARTCGPSSASSGGGVQGGRHAR